MNSLRVPGLQAALVAVFVAALLTSGARAQDHGQEAYDAWIAAFLVKRDLGNQKGLTFFAKALTGPDHNVPDDSWRLALDIMVVEDAYEHTRDPAQLALIDTLLGDFIKINGTDYSRNLWNDDLAWISIMFIRGYLLTDKQTYLDMAVRLWNLAYDRGWDDELGGGIWENRVERPGKEALSNNPFVFSGIALYEATGDKAYLTKATEIYAWVRKNIFDAKTGQVHQGLNPPNTLNRGANVYNSGTFIIAANNLYRVLGNTSYRDDAQKAIDFVMAKGPILRNSDNSQNGSWAYWFIKGLTEFCTANAKWDQYKEYLDANAQSSWSNRHPKSNLTGNDWAVVYAYTDTDKVGPMPSDSGVAIWMMIDPKPTPMPDAGTAMDAGSDAGSPAVDDGGSVAADAGEGEAPIARDAGRDASFADATVTREDDASSTTPREPKSGDSGCSTTSTRGARDLTLPALIVLLLAARRRRWVDLI